MTAKVKQVFVEQDFKLKLLFNTGEWRLFDVAHYLEKGDFKELKERDVFLTAKVFMGTVQWDNELDLAPDTLYINSIPLNF